jgi:PAS domain-containing protein
MRPNVQRALARAGEILELDAGATAAVALDAERRFVYVSDAAARLLATPGDELLDRCAGAFTAAADKAMVDAIWETALVAGTASGRHVAITPHGERAVRFWLLTNLEPDTHVLFLAADLEGHNPVTRAMAARGRYVCSECGIHSPPGLGCPSCGGTLVALD